MSASIADLTRSSDAVLDTRSFEQWPAERVLYKLTQGIDLVGVRCGQLEHLSTVYRAPSCALTPAEVDLCVAIHDNMQDMFFLALE